MQLKMNLTSIRPSDDSGNVKKKESKSFGLVQTIPEVVDLMEPAEKEMNKKKKRKSGKHDTEKHDEKVQENLIVTSGNKFKKDLKAPIIGELLETVTKRTKKSMKNKSYQIGEPMKIEHADPQTESKLSEPLSTLGEPNQLKGANAVYSTNVIQIPSHVAQKMTTMSVHNFKNANIANVVGYGLSEEIEVKTVQTKIGNVNNTDKYSLYNMDKMTTRLRVNPRKMFSKLKKTKNSIQVI